MKKISRRAFLLAASGLAVSTLAGCGQGPASSSAASSAAAQEVHEPLVLIDANRDYSALLALLHQKYPEVNVQIDAYKGDNTSAYMRKQLESGCLPDIYNTTYSWDPALQKERLVDLSKYSVTDLYNPFCMAETDIDGATYLLPYDFTFFCLACNQTLFQRQGWNVPQTFAELRTLVPQIRRAGFRVANCLINYPGFGFQYFCNVSDTVFLNSLDGIQWQKDFLLGEQSAFDALQDCKNVFQEWIDLDLLNMDDPYLGIYSLTEHFQSGNTAFALGGLTSYTQNGNGSGDQYTVLPYLSETGKKNTYIISVGRYYGLNKDLEAPGNEQKLEDALHFLEVLSSPEGYEALIGDSASTMSSLRGFLPPETSVFYSAMREVNLGHTAPKLYPGWEAYVAPFGAKVREWIDGTATGDEALACLDELQHEELTSGGDVIYTNVTEMLTTEQAAQLVGLMFTEAVSADAALISYNVYKPTVPAPYENCYGANGRILPGGMTENDIVSFLPTGWYRHIQTVTLSGARIKALARDGFDFHGDGNTYPYVLTLPEETVLHNDSHYTVVICGVTDAIAAEGSLRDTGVLGLDAAKHYLQHTAEVSSALLR